LLCQVRKYLLAIVRRDATAAGEKAVLFAALRSSPVRMAFAASKRALFLR
jgi:hypothetical protein